MPTQTSRIMDVVLPVVTIKNTFINLVDEEGEDPEEGQPPRPRRRCASLPPQAKLLSEGAAAAASDGDAASTASWRSGGGSPRGAGGSPPWSQAERWSDMDEGSDSDDGSGPSRRCESPDPWRDPGVSDGDTDCSGSTRAASRVTLCLQNQIAAKDQVATPAPPSGRTPLRTPLRSSRTPLKSGSRMFTPQAPSLPTLPPEVLSVLSAAQAGLSSCPMVCSTKVSEGSMGGAAEVTAEVPAFAPVSDEHLMTCAKTALLGATASGSTVCVLGYGHRPFQDLGDGRFSCTLALVPAEKRRLMCFDICQKGFCPRAGTCRWCHPEQGDLLKVVVRVQRVHAR